MPSTLHTTAPGKGCFCFWWQSNSRGLGCQEVPCTAYCTVQCLTVAGEPLEFWLAPMSITTQVVHYGQHTVKCSTCQAVSPNTKGLSAVDCCKQHTANCSCWLHRGGLLRDAHQISGHSGRSGGLGHLRFAKIRLQIVCAVCHWTLTQIYMVFSQPMVPVPCVVT